MILYGKPLMEQMQGDLQTRIAALKEQGVCPTLATVQVGSDPAAEGYLASILRRGESVGVKVHKCTTEENFEQAILLRDEIRQKEAQ